MSYLTRDLEALYHKLYGVQFPPRCFHRQPRVAAVYEDITIK